MSACVKEQAPNVLMFVAEIIFKNVGWVKYETVFKKIACSAGLCVF